MVQIALAPCSPFSVTTRADGSTAELARQARLPAAHPSRRDRGREPLLPASSTAAARSTISRSAAGSTSGPGSRTASISTPMKCSGSARRGIGVSHCPPAATRCWRRAAARSASWRRPACAVGLGVDGSASNDASNLMQEVRAAFLLQRAPLRRQPRSAIATRCAGRPRARRAASAAPTLGEIARGQAGRPRAVQAR